MLANIKPKLVDISKLFSLDQQQFCWKFNKSNPWVPEIDEDYHFDAMVTQGLLLGLEHNKRVLLQGLHGTGKSTHIEQIAARLNWPCLRLNLDAYMTRSELLGRDVIKKEEGKDGSVVTSFQEGLLIWALKNPVILILDEYDAARPELLFIFQRLLEAEGKLVVFDENKVVDPHPYFRLLATCNTLGFGDTSGLYQGTQILNQGQLDRWSMIIPMDFLSPKDEAHMIMNRVPCLKEKNKILVGAMVALANLTRQSFKQNTLSLFLSPRTLINWAELIIYTKNIQQAFDLAFGNRIAEIDRPLIEELYQRALGNKDFSL